MVKGFEFARMLVLRLFIVVTDLQLGLEGKIDRDTCNDDQAPGLCYVVGQPGEDYSHHSGFRY
jgi:hypothetical protein